MKADMTQVITEVQAQEAQVNAQEQTINKEDKTMTTMTMKEQTGLQSTQRQMDTKADSTAHISYWQR